MERIYKIDNGETFEGSLQVFEDCFGGVGDHRTGRTAHDSLIMCAFAMFGPDTKIEWSDDGENWVLFGSSSPRFTPPLSSRAYTDQQLIAMAEKAGGRYFMPTVPLLTTIEQLRKFAALCNGEPATDTADNVKGVIQ